jgi:sodium/hydrogen antiporter
MDDWALATIAAILLGYAVVSGRLTGTLVTPAIVFVTAGYLVGSDGLDLIGARSAESTVRLTAEATLTLVLFSDAARIDLRALRREFVLPLRLLGIGLPLTILLGGLVALAMFGTLAWPEAFLIAVLLAPTDAALGQAVVTDPRLPSRIRQGLNVESGLNDGICVPVLFILLAAAERDAGNDSTGGALRLLGEALGYGVLGGVVAGGAAALLLRVPGLRSTVDSAWLQAVPVAAAALAYGLAAPIGGSGFIAAFVAGIVFGGLLPEDHEHGLYLTEEAGGLLSALTFLLFGAALLGPVLDQLDARIVIYALLSLTLVRMVPVALALLGSRARPPTVAFVGWFGPRGLASIVFAVIVIEGADLPGTPTMLAVTFLTVTLSVFLHGITAQPLTNRYARWWQTHARDEQPQMEAGAAPEQRWRRADLKVTGPG